MTEPRHKIRTIGLEADDKGLYIYLNAGFSIVLIILAFLWGMADIIGLLALLIGSYMDSVMVRYLAALVLQGFFCVLLFIVFRIIMEIPHVLPAFRRLFKGRLQIPARTGISGNDGLNLPDDSFSSVLSPGVVDGNDGVRRMK